MCVASRSEAVARAALTRILSGMGYVVRWHCGDALILSRGCSMYLTLRQGSPVMYVRGCVDGRVVKAVESLLGRSVVIEELRWSPKFD